MDIKELVKMLETQKTKIAQKTLEYLNNNYYEIICHTYEGSRYWSQSYRGSNSPNSQVFNYINRWLNKQGYTYLYDVDWDITKKVLDSWEYKPTSIFDTVG